MKRPYRAPQASSRRLYNTTLSADDWRFIMEMVAGFVFIYDSPTEIWPSFGLLN